MADKQVPKAEDLDFTPGRWTVSDEKSNIRIIDEQEVTIATIWKQPYDPPRWSRNNARLISLSPLLYDALKQLVAAVAESDPIDWMILDNAQEIIQAVEFPGYEPKV